MARPVNLTTDPTKVSAVRTVTGAPVAADSATLTDANIPPLINSTTGGAINCRGLSTIWVDVELTGGTSVVLDPLFRDADAADGSRWHRMMPGATPALNQPVLSGLGFVEIRVDGCLIFPRLKTVTGNTTGVVILARPGAPLAGSKLFAG